MTSILIRLTQPVCRLLLACMLLFVLLFSAPVAHAQCSSHPVVLTSQSNTAFPLPKECMSALHDQNGRPYLYVAGKERGLLVYDVTAISAPVLVDSVPVSTLSGMEVMSLTQDSSYVYLALGNVFSNSALPGMAIVDVSTPSSVVLKSVWQYPVQSGGAAVVRVEGHYAYLGAMRLGLMILDVGNKSLPVLQSVFRPSIYYPVSTGTPDSLKYNARGLAVHNSIAYLCDDKGGVRIINATNKSAPVETGHYANPPVITKGIFYNNAVLDDTILYVAVDYCGVEVLSVADTGHIRQISWWNPWHCDAPSNNWLNSAGHANELQFDPACKDLFVASGKSEVTVVNVSNPASPDSCTGFTTSGGNVGVWGLALWQNQLYTCYIYVPLGIPFLGTWSGFKAFTWNSCSTTLEPSVTNASDLSVFPNPATGSVTVRSAMAPGVAIITVYDQLGRTVIAHSAAVDESGEIHLHNLCLSPGNYILSCTDATGLVARALLVIGY